MGTATAKDDSDWRTFRDEKEKSPDWVIERIPYNATPFVWPEYWQGMRRNMSAREWDRRGKALDVKPENALFYSFSRELNCKPIPRRARDVTSEILGHGYELLLGYDPGNAQHAMLALKAFAMGPQEYAWWVIEELHKEKLSVSDFARFVKSHLNRKYQLDIDGRSSASALIHSDKWVNTEVDHNHPDRSAYVAFKNEGLRIKPAAYAPAKRGQAPKPGSVPVNASIDMVCGLFCNADGESRLHIAVDDSGAPVAPKLVKALENSKRDQLGRAHLRNSKDKRYDLTDFPSALRLGLYPYERIRYVGAGANRGAA